MTTLTDKAQLARYIPSEADCRFADFPFYWLLKLGGCYIQSMEVELKKLDLNITNWRIFLILREEPEEISVSDIANRALGRLPTIAKSISKMGDRGLVKLRRSDTDARVLLVSITPKGLALLDKSIERTSATIAQALDGVCHEEIRQSNSLMKKLIDNLSGN